MEKIILSISEQTMLFEMCNELFDEKIFIEETDNQLFIVIKDKEKTFKIHWFEFCMTCLLNRLLVRKKKGIVNFIIARPRTFDAPNLIKDLYKLM